MSQTYKVITATQGTPWTSQYGTFDVYALQLEGVDGVAEISVKQGNTISPGQELTGDITENAHGKKFKKSAPVFGGNAPATGGSFKSSKNDPEVQKAIIRQNALSNSVAYSIAKFDKKDLSVKEVLEIALIFSKFSEGELVPKVPSKTDEVDIPEDKEPF